MEWRKLKQAVHFRRDQERRHERLGPVRCRARKGPERRREKRVEPVARLSCALGPLVNLSSGGMSVACASTPPVAIGHELEFAIRCGKGELRLSSWIIWIRRTEDGHFEFGTKFSDTDRKDVVQLLTWAVYSDGAGNAMAAAELEMPRADPYATLGVSRDVSTETIRDAYRKLARRFHPDSSRDEGAGRRFMAIHEAYSVLKDSTRRCAYDRSLEQSIAWDTIEPVYDDDPYAFDPGRYPIADSTPVVPAVYVAATEFKVNGHSRDTAPARSVIRGPGRSRWPRAVVDAVRADPGQVPVEDRVSELEVACISIADPTCSSDPIDTTVTRSVEWAAGVSGLPPSVSEDQASAAIDDPLRFVESTPRAVAVVDRAEAGPIRVAAIVDFGRTVTDHGRVPIEDPARDAAGTCVATFEPSNGCSPVDTDFTPMFEPQTSPSADVPVRGEDPPARFMPSVESPSLDTHCLVTFVDPGQVDPAPVAVHDSGHALAAASETGYEPTAWDHVAESNDSRVAILGVADLAYPDPVADDQSTWVVNESVTIAQLGPEDLALELSAPPAEPRQPVVDGEFAGPRSGLAQPIVDPSLRTLESMSAIDATVVDDMVSEDGPGAAVRVAILGDTNLAFPESVADDQWAPVGDVPVIIPQLGLEDLAVEASAPTTESPRAVVDCELAGIDSGRAQPIEGPLPETPVSTSVIEPAAVDDTGPGPWARVAVHVAFDADLPAPLADDQTSESVSNPVWFVEPSTDQVTIADDEQPLAVQCITAVETPDDGCIAIEDPGYAAAVDAAPQPGLTDSDHSTPRPMAAASYVLKIDTPQLRDAVKDPLTGDTLSDAVADNIEFIFGLCEPQAPEEPDVQDVEEVEEVEQTQGDGRPVTRRSLF